MNDPERGPPDALGLGQEGQGVFVKNFPCDQLLSEVNRKRGREAQKLAPWLDTSSYLAGVHGSRTHPGRDHRPASVLKFGAGRPTASYYVNVSTISYLRSSLDRARHPVSCQPVTASVTNSVTIL
jgi:hypothetical protein